MVDDKTTQRYATLLLFVQWLEIDVVTFYFSDKKSVRPFLDKLAVGCIRVMRRHIIILPKILRSLRTLEQTPNFYESFRSGLIRPTITEISCFIRGLHYDRLLD